MTYDEFLGILKSGTSSERNACPVTKVLLILQGKWKNHVLYEMCKHDTVRFGELKKSLPQITNTMLTTTLRELEADGLINREQFNEIPPHVEYSLTGKGSDMMKIFHQMFLWGTKHIVEA